jgi:hypothetical protein
MKKLFLFTLLFLAITTSQAQYKKASFLNKKGRTYDLGATGRILGGGNSAGLGFYFSYGKERSNKRLFHWFDLEYALSHKYNYNSTAYLANGSAIPTPVTVNGKTDASLAYRYNLAYFILDNGNEDNKILPFVDASLGMVFPFTNVLNYTVTPTSIVGPTKIVTALGGAYTAGFGAGAIYKVNNKFGIKFNVAYYGVLSTEQNRSDGVEVFKTLPNHVSVSIGAHWLLDRDN